LYRNSMVLRVFNLKPHPASRLSQSV
jgi:hypothetical protein